MSVASCLLNSKVGDHILLGENPTMYLVAEKKYCNSYSIYPPGFYPVVVSGYGDRTTIVPWKYRINKIIKCQ